MFNDFFNSSEEVEVVAFGSVERDNYIEIPERIWVYLYSSAWVKTTENQNVPGSESIREASSGWVIRNGAEPLNEHRYSVQID